MENRDKFGMKDRAHHCKTLKGRPSTEMEGDGSPGTGAELAGAFLPPGADLGSGKRKPQHFCCSSEFILFSKVPISHPLEEEAGFGADSGCLPRPASEEAVSSPTFQGSHKGLIRT